MDLNKLHQVTKMLIPQSKRYGLESTSTNVTMKLPRDLEITLLADVKSKSTLGIDVQDKSRVTSTSRLSTQVFWIVGVGCHLTMMMARLSTVTERFVFSSPVKMLCCV